MDLSFGLFVEMSGGHNKETKAALLSFPDCKPLFGRTLPSALPFVGQGGLFVGLPHSLVEALAPSGSGSPSVSTSVTSDPFLIILIEGDEAAYFALTSVL